MGKRSFSADLFIDRDMDEIMMDFLVSVYKNENESKKIYLSEDFINSDKLNLIQNIGFTICFPHNDEEKSILRIAKENAALHLMQLITKIDRSESLSLLQKELKLLEMPMRIEGFDIANLLGKLAVASMVSFYGGYPDKKNYKKFNIRLKDSPDDYAMIREAVYRRYKRLKDENLPMPDLILIDGGKGQLNSALSALNELSLSLNLISLAKENEEIYLPNEKNPIILSKNSPALHILQQVRDESHRFANKSYSNRKSKELLSSRFDDILGIGPKKKKILLNFIMERHDFNSITIDELRTLNWNEELIQKVYNKLKM